MIIDPRQNAIQSLTTRQYKWGIYRVGTKQFFNKAQAILEAQRTGTWVEFDYYDDVYSSANLATEPQEELWEIYRRRAQQLRDKYDYLVLIYSSGCDSTTILHSFLYNNIPLDEIFCYGPFSTTQGHSSTQVKAVSANNYREIDLVALPYLRELSKTYNFKLTLHDWTADMINGFQDKTGQVVIQIRDCQGWQGSNPFAIEQVKSRIRRDLDPLYQGQYEIQVVPNIVNITYGHDVGYRIEQETFDDATHAISATKIRKEMGLQ